MKHAYWYIVVGGLCYLVSLILIFKGSDRLTKYQMSEYSSEDDRYAYVGGDAYNYIINTNVMNSYFTISASLLVAGTLFIVAGLIVNAIRVGKLDVMDEKKIIEQEQENSILTDY